MAGCADYDDDLDQWDFGDEDKPPLKPAWDPVKPATLDTRDTKSKPHLQSGGFGMPRSVSTAPRACTIHPNFKPFGQCKLLPSEPAEFFSKPLEGSSSKQLDSNRVGCESEEWEDKYLGTEPIGYNVASVTNSTARGVPLSSKLDPVMKPGIPEKSILLQAPPKQPSPHTSNSVQQGTKIASTFPVHIKPITHTGAISKPPSHPAPSSSSPKPAERASLHEGLTMTELQTCNPDVSPAFLQRMMGGDAHSMKDKQEVDLGPPEVSDPAC